GVRARPGMPHSSRHGARSGQKPIRTTCRGQTRAVRRPQDNPTRPWIHPQGSNVTALQAPRPPTTETTHPPRPPPHTPNPPPPPPRPPTTEPTPPARHSHRRANPPASVGYCYPPRSDERSAYDGFSRQHRQQRLAGFAAQLAQPAGPRQGE